MMARRGSVEYILKYIHLLKIKTGTQKLQREVGLMEEVASVVCSGARQDSIFSMASANDEAEASSPPRRVKASSKWRS